MAFDPPKELGAELAVGGVEESLLCKAVPHSLTHCDCLFRVQRHGSLGGCLGVAFALSFPEEVGCRDAPLQVLGSALEAVSASIICDQFS